MEKFPVIKKSIQEAKAIELTYSGSKVYKFNLLPFGERGTFLEHALLKEVSNGLQETLKTFPDFDYIVSPEPGGHVWGSIAALQSGKSINILRFSPSYDPTEQEVHRKTGYYQHNLYFSHFKKGDRVLILDDVVSTGGTLDTILGTLTSIGVTIVGVQVIYAKTEDYKKIEEKYSVPIKALTVANNI